MTKYGKTGSEPFKVGPVEVEGNASCGLVAFWQELATAEVEGVGKVTIGNSAMGGLSLFAFLPHKDGVASSDHPPTTFIINLEPLAQALIGAAVERYKDGRPAVFYERPGDMDDLAISTELDALEKTPAVPSSSVDKERAERLGELRAEVAKRAGVTA